MIGPLFKWFGSKWMSAKKLPTPLHDTIVEPFAGGAGYSLRHHEKKVFLSEIDPHISVLWKWLIREATQAAILDIPIGVPEGTDIRLLGLTQGQELLMKSWQRTNNVGNCWTVSPWGNRPGQWTANTRSRVAEEVSAIRHWEFVDDVSGLAGLVFFTGPWLQKPITWFVDPPYQYNYQYRNKHPIDYQALAALCRRIEGQAIVCEAVCPKTGKIPDYLPFEFFGSRITSRRKAENHHHSKELLWVRPQAAPVSP